MEDSFFVSTTFAKNGTPVGDVLELCREQKIVNVELGSNHAYEADPIKVVQQFTCNYLVHNYFPAPKEMLIVNIASLDDTIYKRSKQHIFRSLDFCQKIGAKLYTFHPGFLSDPQGESMHSDNYDFQFLELDGRKNYQQAFSRMVTALREIVAYAQKKNVPIAIETEGSIQKKDVLLMQKPEEFKDLFQLFFPKDIGVNLNIGHLILASKAFHFPMGELVDVVAPYVVEMELSHNHGKVDDHLPLQKEGWYWPLIFDARFNEVPKIVETRDTSIQAIVAVRRLFEEKARML